METQRFEPDKSPVVVIVGETGSGKSALAIELARQFNGEIIAADSRTVYRGMDIGTAKPTLEERQEIPHYGFDVVDPDCQFTAYDFQQLAKRMVIDIASRGRIPIIVGGTGLYIDAFLYDFVFRPKVDDIVRAELESLSVTELQKRILVVGLPLPENARNPRHLRRLLESGVTPMQSKVLRSNTLVLGLRVPRDKLEERISTRVETMFAAGLIGEVQTLLDRYRVVEALRAPGYKAVEAYLKGKIDLAEAKRQFRRDDLRLAKRQRTWFRRNADICWLDSANRLAQAAELVSAFLQR